MKKVTLELPENIIDRLKAESSRRTSREGGYCSYGRIVTDLVTRYMDPLDAYAPPRKPRRKPVELPKTGT